YLADLIRHLAIDVVEHQFGIAKDGVERRAQLMADISEELRFVLARDFELAALLVDLGEEAGIVDGERRLRRKGLEQLDNGRGKGAGCAAPDDKRADDTIAAKERHHQQRPEARLEDELLEREMRRFEEIGNLGRLAGLGGFADGGVAELRLMAGDGVDEIVGHAMRRAQREFLARLVEDINRAGIRLGKL